MKQQAFFLQRINDHVQYLNKIKATLSKKGDFQGSDCHHCTLGKWLDGEGHEQARALGGDVSKLFEQLIDPHQKFHEASAQALTCMSLGDEVGQYRAMTEMHQLSNHLVQKLLEIDRHAMKKNRIA